MLQIEWINDSTLTEVVLLVIAFVLSALVGLERHRQLKSAGLRTHALVGLGSATFTLVSSYGFHAILGAEVVLDPSRISAQIVSGIGFLGAGVIFVRQNVVNGLTTAASIWVVAAIGMACGAGMPVLAGLTTALQLVVVTVLSKLAKHIPAAGGPRELVVIYKDGRGVLRQILAEATARGYVVSLSGTVLDDEHTPARVHAHLKFLSGQAPLPLLVESLQGISGVKEIRFGVDEGLDRA